ncbi:MAG: radical SAM protein [Planctomycetota bacterium]|nr:radical SAM protein [Planctomycetota bacterium]
MSRTSDRKPPFLARLLGQAVARIYLRRPEMAEVIAIRYRSLRGFLVGVGNELAYRLGLQRAPGLISANLELTNHCNLKCSFCPTGNGLLARPRGFMEPEVFRRALAGAGPLEFMLLFQWGESLLHPQFGVLAQEARAHGARTLVTTNGTLLDDRRTETLLGAGLDRVTVSVDGDAESHAAIRGVPLARTEAGLDRLIAERDRRDLDLAIDVSMVVSPETEHAVEAFEARYADRVDRVQKIPLLTCGERRTRCREPWRGGLVVLQDGQVTVCCVDHDGELAFGDVSENSLRSLWNGPAMKELRRQHVEGDLPPICARCTEYPTDAAAPRFSKPKEASKEAPHMQLPPRGDQPHGGPRPRRGEPAA